MQKYSKHQNSSSKNTANLTVNVESVSRFKKKITLYVFLCKIWNELPRLGININVIYF